MELVKICTVCKKELPASSEYFHRHPKGKYGYQATCKSCSKIIMKAYRSTNEYKKKNREAAAIWRKNNPEKALEISRKRYKLNALEINKKKKERFQADKDYRQKVLEREKRYKASGRRHEMNAKPEMREKARARNRQRRMQEDKKAHDYGKNAIWRAENANYIRELDKKRREEITNSYVASSMRKSVKDIPKEVLETRRVIVQIKRELKKNNIKIK